MMKRISILLAAALPLAGCATTSFAPPGVQVKYVDEASSTLSCAESRRRRADQTITVERSVTGALRVVETYIDAYDCAARQAADGRQGFEIPAFAATTGAVVGAAFGLPADYAIAGTAANSVFNAGKAYYDPKQKALVYSHAVDALRCIRNEAMGIDNFLTFKKDSDEKDRQREAFRAGETRTAEEASVALSAQQQYFAMVTNAAGSVSGILADRLSNVGTFNPAGTAAELEKLLADIRAKEEEKKKETDKPAENPTGTPGQEGFVPMSQSKIQQLKDEKLTDLNLKTLQPKLQACIWRAKV